MIELKHDTALVGARNRESNFPVEVYDDSMGPLWICGFEYGPTMIIRASSFEAAWEIWVDESQTIDEDDVPEAYGFYDDNAALKLRQAGELADAGEGDYPELQEGYYHQSNANGTGIVNVGHYAWLRELDRNDLDDIRLVVRHHDDADNAENVSFAIGSYDYSMTVRGKTKSFRSFALHDDIGERIRRLERAFGTVNVETNWGE